MNVCVENISKEQDDFLCCQGDPIWLQEDTLLPIIKEIYKTDNISVTKYLKIPGLRTYPDFLLENEKIIIEFQGYHHFTKKEVVYRDNYKRNFHLFSGYKLIEIPYFIQLDEDVTEKLFGIRKDFSNGFPHGFLHPKLSLPGDFCKIGYERYKNLLEFYGEKIQKDILSSLQMRANILKLDLYTVS